jgi:hypothetical protein
MSEISEAGSVVFQVKVWVFQPAAAAAARKPFPPSAHCGTSHCRKTTVLPFTGGPGSGVVMPRVVGRAEYLATLAAASASLPDPDVAGLLAGAADDDIGAPDDAAALLAGAAADDVAAPDVAGAALIADGADDDAADEPELLHAVSVATATTEPIAAPLTSFDTFLSALVRNIHFSLSDRLVERWRRLVEVRRGYEETNTARPQASDTMHDQRVASPNNVW